MNIRRLVEMPKELWLVAVALLASLALIAAWNVVGFGGSLRDYLFFFWGPQLVLVLVLMLVFRARPATAAGAALAFSGFLLCFIAWARSVEDLSGLVWLAYFCSLPGGVAGAIAARVVDRRWTRALPAVGASFGAAAAGIAVNAAGLVYAGLVM